MIADLIVEYNKLTLMLEAAIQADNFKEIAEIDTELTRVWGEIISVEVDNTEERRRLAEFLLDQISKAAEGSRLTQQIKQKILEMIS